MQFAGGKSRSTRGMIALRAIVCFANADERCSSLRDSRNECNLPEANDDTGSRYSTGLHRPCGRFVPLRGTGRVDTRPYAKPGAWVRAPAGNRRRKGPRHKPRAQGCRGLTPPAGLQSFDRVRANYSPASFGAMSRHRKVTIWARVQPSVRPDSVVPSLPV